MPTEYSKVCSCHFKDNLKKNGPTIFERDIEKAIYENYRKMKRRKYVELFKFLKENLSPPPPLKKAPTFLMKLTNCSFFTDAVLLMKILRRNLAHKS